MKFIHIILYTLARHDGKYTQSLSQPECMKIKSCKDTPADWSLITFGGRNTLSVCPV